MKTLPWYCKPHLTCKLLNRIANKIHDNDHCKTVMDQATMALWSKQECFYNGRDNHAIRSGYNMRQTV